jgi:hypothetical protein
MAVRQRGVPFLPSMPCGCVSRRLVCWRQHQPDPLALCALQLQNRPSTAVIADVMQVSGHFHRILVAVRNKDFRLWLEGSKQVAPRKTAKFTTAEANSSNSANGCL